MIRGTAGALVVALAAVACGASQSAVDEAAVEEEARAAIVSLFEAMNASDAEAVLAAYSSDEYVRVACTEFHEKALFERLVESYYRGEREPELEYEIRAAGALGADAAYVTAVGSSVQADALLWSWVLEREDGELKIVHEHESWPGCPKPREPFHDPEDMGGAGPVPDSAMDADGAMGSDSAGR